MANNVYTSFKSRLLTPGVNLMTANLKGLLVSVTSGTANFPYGSNDEFVSSIPTAAIVATGVALTNKSIQNGQLLAAPLVFPTVSPVGSQVAEALVLYIDTGVNGTSPLFMWMNQQTGLPVVPNGSNITVNWPSFVMSLV